VVALSKTAPPTARLKNALKQLLDNSKGNNS
jgi:hypothetical protein